MHLVTNNKPRTEVTNTLAYHSLNNYYTKCFCKVYGFKFKFLEFKSTFILAIYDIYGLGFELTLL